MSKIQNIAVAAFATAGLVLTGCGSGTPSTKQSAGPASAPTSSSATSAPVSSEPPAVEEPTPTPEESTIAKVGPTQWFTYEDNLQVQIPRLTKFTISDTASGGKPGGIGVIVTITIKNATAATFDASSVQVNMSTGPNGDTAEQVFDSARNVGGGFEGSIAKGRSKTAKVGFAVPKAHLGQLTIEVVPSFEHNGSIFEGAAK